jgi:hypothetical protein
LVIECSGICLDGTGGVGELAMQLGLRHTYRTTAGLAVGLILLLLVSLGSATAALPAPPPLHLPPVTMHSMDAIQAEIVDARTKLQRDYERSHQRPAPDGKSRH